MTTSSKIDKPLSSKCVVPGSKPTVFANNYYTKARTTITLNEYNKPSKITSANLVILCNASKITRFRRQKSITGNREQALKIYWNKKPEKNYKPFLETVLYLNRHAATSLHTAVHVPLREEVRKTPVDYLKLWSRNSCPLFGFTTPAEGSSSSIPL